MIRRRAPALRDPFHVGIATVEPEPAEHGDDRRDQRFADDEVGRRPSSKIVTFLPRIASSEASVEPDGPPPITATVSTLLLIV